MAAIVRRKHATEMGFIEVTEIFIAKNDDPQIALNRNSKKILLLNLSNNI
tara:strand:+ start:146 stop:295 length:150 start_codon:yes stop_codon:yes gene_type:complete